VSSSQLCVGVWALKQRHYITRSQSRLPHVPWRRFKEILLTLARTVSSTSCYFCHQSTETAGIICVKGQNKESPSTQRHGVVTELQDQASRDIARSQSHPRTPGGPARSLKRGAIALITVPHSIFFPTQFSAAEFPTYFFCVGKKRVMKGLPPKAPANFCQGRCLSLIILHSRQLESLSVPLSCG